MWLTRTLRRYAKEIPDALALADATRELTWRDLSIEVDRLGAFICASTDRGARVAFLSHSRAEHFVLLFACAMNGRTFVPLNPNLTTPELVHQVSLVTPSLVFHEAATDKSAALLVDKLDWVRARDVDDVPDARPTAPALLRLEDPAVIFFTSATTGRPKGVQVPERSLRANSVGWQGDVLERYPDARFLSACPLYHGSSVIALDYLSNGRPVHIMRSFNPRSWLRAVKRNQISHSFLVPSMITLLMKVSQLDRSETESLVLLAHGAAPMPSKLAEEARDRLGVDLFSVYGITEGGGPAIVGTLPPSLIGPFPGATYLGFPLKGMIARVLDDEGRPAPPGHAGEIALRGDGLMTQYWHDPGATTQSIVDGWLRTHDVGVQDDEGVYWILDRRTDLIIRGGQNVYPAEVEAVVRTAPGVRDAAVVAAPSTIWGQTPVAYVVPTEQGSTSEADIVGWCAGRLASYKTPTQVIFIPELPVGPSGKVLRRALRKFENGVR